MRGGESFLEEEEKGIKSVSEECSSPRDCSSEGLEKELDLFEKE